MYIVFKMFNIFRNILWLWANEIPSIRKLRSCKKKSRRKTRNLRLKMAATSTMRKRYIEPLLYFLRPLCIVGHMILSFSLIFYYTAMNSSWILNTLSPSTVDLIVKNYCQIFRGGRHFRSLYKKGNSKAVKKTLFRAKLLFHGHPWACPRQLEQSLIFTRFFSNGKRLTMENFP